MTTPDRELAEALERARAGEPRGFDTLFRALGGQVVGYLRGRGVDDPGGLANDVFVRAFSRLDTFEGGHDRFRSYLFGIAHNAAIDDSRRRRRRVAETPIDSAPEAAGGDVEADAIVRLAEERVRALLQGVSPDQADVLLLRIVADLSVERTAEVVGKSPEAVKALQRRGLATLRRQLSGEQGVSR